VPLGKIDYRHAETPSAINCNFVPHNEEQEPLATKAVNLLRAGYDHIFEAPTGWGKSVVGSVVACRLGQPTMIVVNKSDLMDSWYDALVNVLKVPAALVGKVQQNTCDWQGKRIVIGMAHSLCIPDRYPMEMYRYFGFLLVDEVDTTPTDQFSPLFRLFPARYRMGMSATPDRKDGKWQVVQGNIGPTLVKGTLIPMSPKILVKQTGWKIPKSKRWENGELVEVPIPYTPGRMGLVEKAMANSMTRNMNIVEFAHAAYRADRRTLILCSTLEHLSRLFQMLASHGVPGNDIGYYVGGMKKHELERGKNSRIILGTYKMVDRGTNVPIWDSLSLGTPRADVKQAIGRVLRFMEGKKQPVIQDLVDYDKIFQSYHMARVKQYYAVHAEIVRMS
jgi:superfamily II DNA or RNA helicase